MLVEAPSAPRRLRLSRFALFAWLVLAYNLAVVMWGAFVRATGSGAGCGNHWPLCNGQVLPRSPALGTIIELTHRLSSGVALIAILALLFWGFRAFPKGHPVRLGASLAVFFTFTEALIGAGLVLFEKTAQDKSFARVASLSVHLINTFLLVACIALTAWWASGGKRIVLKDRGNLKWMIAAGVLGMLLLGVSGAVTALGDTLYPSASLREGLNNDLSPVAPFLIRFRIYHPLLSMIVGGYLAAFAVFALFRRAVWAARPFAVAVVSLVFVQWAIGALDVVLLAPAWIQLIHLLFADLLWVAAVLLSATLLQADYGLPAHK